MARTLFRDEVEAFYRRRAELEAQDLERRRASGRLITMEEDRERRKGRVETTEPYRGRRASPEEAEAFHEKMHQQWIEARARADWYCNHDSCDGPYPGARTEPEPKPAPPAKPVVQTADSAQLDADEEDISF